jgi:hypothetical protein
MSAHVDLTLDGVVFGAAGVTGGKALWQDRTGGVPAGFASLTHEVRPPNAQSKNIRVIGKYTRPVVAPEDASYAAPGSIIRIFYADLTVTFSPNSTSTERAQAWDEFVAALGATAFVSSIDNGGESVSG